jgi:hypothetical protein
MTLEKGVQRWYKVVSPLLKSYYGTGGDLNVDEIHEVIPMTEECGVWHPQEGVLMVILNLQKQTKLIELSVASRCS